MLLYSLKNGAKGP